MNKRIIAIILTACLLLFGGCQLAKPESGTITEPDRLVGVYLTIDLSLLSVDGQTYAVSEHDDPDSGKLIETDSSGRIYAEVSEKISIDADGAEYLDRTYKFPGVDGIFLASVKETKTDENGETFEYTTTNADDGFCKIHTNYAENLCEISGTVYLSKAAGETIIYNNPVYQTASGSVYMLPGTGDYFSSEDSSTVTISLSETTGMTKNGQTQEFTSVVRVGTEFAEPVESIVLIQMDSENNILRKDALSCVHLPDEFAPEQETAYIIVEKHSENAIDRSVYDRNDEYFDVLCQGDGKLCVTNLITLSWN